LQYYNIIVDSRQCIWAHILGLGVYNTSGSYEHKPCI